MNQPDLFQDPMPPLIEELLIDRVPVLSIRQPWPWAILYAGKDIENRSWYTSYRGPILIHAGKRLDADDIDYLREGMGADAPAKGSYRLGGIIGRTEIVDCVTESESRWFFGPYGFVLRNSQPLPFFPCKGQLGLFQLNVDTRGARCPTSRP